MAGQMLFVNPRKRRKRRKTSRRRTRRNPIARVSAKAPARRRKRLRSNPIRKPNLKNIGSIAINSLAGGAGAVASDTVTRFLPIPHNWKSGALAPVTKSVVGLGLGYLVGSVLKQRKLGDNIAEGTLAVSGYMVAKRLMSRFSSRLGDYDEGLLAYDHMGAYVGDMDDPLGFDESLMEDEFGEPAMGAYVGDMNEGFDFEDADYFEADTMGDWENAGALADYDNLL